MRSTGRQRAASEADQNLTLATSRLDKALDRSLCGMWDWNLAEGTIFWSKSMFELLGMTPKGDFPHLPRIAGAAAFLTMRT